MSFPYPQDRHRDRKEKGEQPYKDAKESMAQEQAEDVNQAHPTSQEGPRTSGLSHGGRDIPRDLIDSMRRAGEAADEEGKPGQP